MTDEASHIQKYPVERPSGRVNAKDIERLAQDSIDNMAEIERQWRGFMMTPTAKAPPVREVEQIEKELWALGPDLCAILPAEAATDAPE
jgi:hypothetical protein